MPPQSPSPVESPTKATLILDAEGAGGAAGCVAAAVVATAMAIVVTMRSADEARAKFLCGCACGARCSRSVIFGQGEGVRHGRGNTGRKGSLERSVALGLPLRPPRR